MGCQQVETGQEASVSGCFLLEVVFNIGDYNIRNLKLIIRTHTFDWSWLCQCYCIPWFQLETTSRFEHSTKHWFNKEEACQMGPIVSFQCPVCLWNVRSLWSNNLHKKPAALSVWLTQPLHWVRAVTTGQAPIDHPAHRSGSSKTTRSRDLEHWWHLSTVHWRPSMQTTWSPAQSLIRYLLNVFWAELNIFF